MSRALSSIVSSLVWAAVLLTVVSDPVAAARCFDENNHLITCPNVFPLPKTSCWNTTQEPWKMVSCPHEKARKVIGIIAGCVAGGIVAIVCCLWYFWYRPTKHDKGVEDGQSSNDAEPPRVGKDGPSIYHKAADVQVATSHESFPAPPPYECVC